MTGGAHKSCLLVMKNLLTLPEIIDRVADDIKSSPLIYAMWLEGSYATGRFNQQSDIDVWLDVDDDSFDACISIFRHALSTVVGIDHESGAKGVYSQNPKLQKHTFYLKGYVDDNCIELDLQEHSRNFNFSQTKHAIQMLFDKDHTIT